MDPSDGIYGFHDLASEAVPVLAMGHHMSLHHGLAALFLACFIGHGLHAQGYETKFKAIGFKPGDVYHTDEGVNVSLTGGGLEVEIPLGPPLPGPIPIRPVVHYHGKYSQPLNPSWSYGQAFRDGFIGRGWSAEQVDAYERAYKRWLPPNLPFGEAHPGHLSFRAGSTALGPLSPDLTLTSPFGKVTSYFLGMPGAYTYSSSKPGDVADISTLAKTMAPEWDPMAAPMTGPGIDPLPGTPVSRSLGTALGVRLSGGTTLVFGPSVDRIYRRWTASINPITSDLLLVPHEILQVDKNFITLWRRSRNVYSHDWDPKDVNGTLADYRWNQSVYHPVWIKTRSGFRADIVIYRNAPAGHNGALSDGGILTGYRVSTNNGATWFQVGYAPGTTSGPAVTFGGMDTEQAEGAGFNGLTPPRPGGSGSTPLDDFQPGTTLGYDSNYGNPFFWELEYASSALSFDASSITYGGLTTRFEWGGPQGQLSRLTTPSGKTYVFTHELFRGVGPDARTAANGLNWLWTSQTPSALDYYSMVTRMEVQENLVGAAPTRSTTYRWKLPEVDQASPQGTTLWTSPAQGVAQTLPSGETILHVFSSPLDSDRSSGPLELAGRTLLAGRQAVAARYHYASGDTSWESFFTTGADPSTTTWYARERFEGWDIRSWETRIRMPHGANPIYLSTNTEPRPTRTIKEERDGPVEVTELDGWNNDLSAYEVKRTYVMAPGSSPRSQFWAPGALEGLNAPLSPGDTSYVRRPGLAEPTPAGALAHQVSQTTFSADKTAALLDREQMVETKVILAPPTGAIGFTGRTQNTFDSGRRAHIVTQADQLDLLGGGNALSLSFEQKPLGLFEVNQLMSVRLSSTMASAGLNGQVGATYGYDATGRFMTSIQQMGAGWREQEPDHDDMGRPRAHVDPNGIRTGYAWDVLGRLIGLTPAGRETPTTIRPEDTLRRTTLTRGSQNMVYHYNGFGELTGEERTGPGGQVSHKIHGYDTGGRKTFETAWRSGPVPDLGEWASLRAGGQGITAWTYDGRGRVIRVVNANGEVTDTDYPTPLRTRRKVHPDVDGARAAVITTFDRDVLGRLWRVTDALGQVTSYAYDASGRVRQVQQGTQIRSWTYDLFGRLETLVQPESGMTKYSGFTVTGKPTRTTYGYGSAAPRTLTTVFDSLSRPLAITSSDGSVDQAFVYDGAPAGGRAEFGDARAQLSYSRDRSIELWHTYRGLNGRLSGLDTRIGNLSDPSTPGPIFRQAFDYADDGLRQSASVEGRTQRLALDAASRLPLGVTHSQADGYTLQVANFTQDAVLWAPTRIDYGNGAFTDLGYRPDQSGLARLSHTLPGAPGPRLSWAYSYDGAGWLKGDGQDAYRYDGLGRLTQAVVQRQSGSQVLTQNLTYDMVGNLLSSKATADVGLLPDSITNFTFPANASELIQHNQLPSAQTGARYDPQGNLTYLWKTSSASGSFLQMTYDALGRVSALYDSASGTREIYAYTPEGLRTRIDLFKGSTLWKTRFKVYNDQRQMVSEYEAVGAGAAQSAAPQTFLAGTAKAKGAPDRPRPRHGLRTAHKEALLLAESRGGGRLKPSQRKPAIRYRNNDGSFPGPTPSLIDNNGPAGAYITYPIGPVSTTLGASVSFTGTTDYGATYSWDFGDGTSPVSGTLNPGSRAIPTTSHIYNALSSPTFQVTLTVRNTEGGYTQSSATLNVAVVMPTLPIINAFTANGLKDTATVYWGDPSTLAWDVAGATSLHIDQNLGEMAPVTQGSTEVSNLQTTTTFTLTATNAAGSVTQGVRIRVLPKTLVFSAAANPIDAGTGTSLDWNVAGATVITLQEGAGTPWTVLSSGTRPVAPLSPTVYTLAASNDDGTSPPSLLQLDVSPVISEFSASPSVIIPGQASTLSWTTVGADLALSLEPEPGPVTGSNRAVFPQATTTYRLTATNAYRSVSRETTVTVDGRPAILSSPQSQSVEPGQTATFSVRASGVLPLSYQWMKNGVPLTGATTASYTTPRAAMEDSGSTYTVAVSNAYGSVTSDPATLTVIDASQAGGLVWKRDIVYVGTREVGEIDADGLHITQVDHLGSPRLLTDKNGTLEDEQKYMPFGQHLDGLQKTRKGFTGHEQTDGSGLIYMQARFYAPMYGRFLSPDPTRDQHFEETQSWNIFSYVQNNPVTKIDPDGMEDYWVVIDAADPRRMAHVYVTRNDGSLRATYDARAMGVKSAHHRRDVKNGDTPYGTAKAGRIMIGRSAMEKKYGKEKAKSYGEAKINLLATAGELKSTGRAADGVAIHGGGGNLGDHAYDAQQRLDNTQGCVRMHNQDVAVEATQIQQNAQHGEVATIHIGTPGSLRSEAKALNAAVPGVNNSVQSNWFSRIVRSMLNLLD